MCMIRALLPTKHQVSGPKGKIKCQKRNQRYLIFWRRKSGIFVWGKCAPILSPHEFSLLPFWLWWHLKLGKWIHNSGSSVSLEEVVKGAGKEGQEARRRGTPTQEKTGWGYKSKLRGKTSSLSQDSLWTKGMQASQYELQKFTLVESITPYNLFMNNWTLPILIESLWFVILRFRCVLGTLKVFTFHQTGPKDYKS